jgi:myo-inositol 2-dehydrogenase / D-chiro-inositol 1-dehydrogenase
MLSDFILHAYSSISPTMSFNRRRFLQTSAALAGVAGVGYGAFAYIEKKNRPTMGVIGNGFIANAHGKHVARLTNLLATCDVESTRAAEYNQKFAHGRATVYTDYRELLERPEIDTVLIATPDHWHVKIAIDALRAGKDVYCEKPATLTIEEGRILSRVVKETGRVLNIGTQQRDDEFFLTAVALAHSGRVGQIKRVTVAINAPPPGEAFQTAPVPPTLNWEMWLGQAPLVDYIPERYTKYRWWYEYSGGKITDWGAHHVDIAQWAIAPDNSVPSSYEVVLGEHPVPFEHGQPTVHNTFNVAKAFNVKCVFPNGVEMMIRDNANDLGFENGIMFECEKGRFFVNRGKLTGKPVEELKTNPLPADAIAKLRLGRPRTRSYLEKFLAARIDGKPPQSDIVNHVRNLNTCHLAAIALRLNRKLEWDAATQTIVNDDEANAFQSRPQRAGYEVT